MLNQQRSLLYAVEKVICCCLMSYKPSTTGEMALEEGSGCVEPGSGCLLVLAKGVLLLTDNRSVNILVPP